MTPLPRFAAFGSAKRLILPALHRDRDLMNDA
jgi:hypothetical protein